MYYSFLIQQLLYVCYAYLLITKLLKILIFAHGEHNKKINNYVFNFILYSHSQLVTGARDADIVTVCVFVRHLFSWYPFYFDFHRARIIFDVSSGFYLWNINNTKADICKK